jgi:AAA ATPase domain
MGERGSRPGVPVPDHWSYCSKMAATATPAFRGRLSERRALDGVLERARGGESTALVLRGEAGIGKSALLSYCARQAPGCLLVKIAGVDSEMDLPFAALHQFCAPMLGDLDALPQPQGHALRVAFGLEAGSASILARTEMPIWRCPAWAGSTGVCKELGDMLDERVGEHGRHCGLGWP